ncbi:MAG: 2-oxoacid:acceptor oxidoreductase family protein [Myxococcota bacterium]|jgi:indolepyruvate ferredoxin oxidoreductase beta subunit|nr:2-oxoacid:acceptor oxidoreductase family protein [Myxococcota bacterium]
MERFDVFLIGVGGQGIGLLSEALLRAADAAGLTVRGVDTHGLAQRGGVVSSHLRLGEAAHSPLVSPGEAHLVVALERHEALRGLTEWAAPGGTLVYYDAVWQPLGVRLGQVAAVEGEAVQAECARRGVRGVRVCVADLPDSRMQNVAVLAAIARQALLPGVGRDHYRQALGDLLGGAALAANLALFDRLVT